MKLRKRISHIFWVGFVAVFSVCSGCASQSTGTTGKAIKINQLGYMVQAPKIAIVPDTGVETFTVLDVADNRVAFEGRLSPPDTWALSGDTVRQANFSGLNKPGSYRVRVDGLDQSHVFDISESIYQEVHDAALKAYYFNRASTPLDERHAGKWARAAGHPDTNIRVHASAATESRPAGTRISAPKGWYDAGDYNKYVVNSGISTYTLLLALNQFADFYQNRELNIPESGDAVPDLLNEIMWNLEWMEFMQDEDGGVYHKLTTKRFSSYGMPNRSTAPRYVVHKNTAATLNFAAVMAFASRTLSQYEQFFPGKSAQYRSAAIKAWKWAEKNPNVPYKQPPDIETGEYGDHYLKDEFAWAAAELFLLTGLQDYVDVFRSLNQAMKTPDWAYVGPLGFISLTEFGKQAMRPEDFESVSTALITFADELLNIQKRHPYDIAMQAQDFVWGSNSVALNQALTVLQAFRATDDPKYKHAAHRMLDYIFGKNATDFSFVTGFGDITPMDPHHRPSKADGIVEPVPGFVVGGPHAGRQDGCAGYPSMLPAKSYLDAMCSYSTNEVTINWNAPLVYVLAALLSE